MTRYEKAEQDYQEKFKAKGLDEAFELLRRDWTSEKGKKVFVKCRSCGHVFNTWGFNEILRHRRDVLSCSECGRRSDGSYIWARSPKCDAAMEYYQQGHSVRETAEKFGTTKTQINNIVKERKLSNGKDWREEGAKENHKRSELSAYTRPKRERSSHVQRAKSCDAPYEYGITLQKLIKRDGLQCALCGGKCDLSSSPISNFYPSIDHIIPLTKGGGHTWDNVQIAHRICNSLKGNALEGGEAI